MAQITHNDAAGRFTLEILLVAGSVTRGNNAPVYVSVNVAMEREEGFGSPATSTRIGVSTSSIHSLDAFEVSSIQFCWIPGDIFRPLKPVDRRGGWLAQRSDAPCSKVAKIEKILNT